MNDYILFTDSACDIPTAQLKERGVEYCSLTTYFEHENRSYTIDELDSQAFYEKLRNGYYAKTAAVNIETFTVAFERILQRGLDILYIGLSAQVSSTYNAAYQAAQALAEKYPARKIIPVNSCSGSAGQAMLLSLVLEQKNNGATLEEAAAFAEKTKDEICLWATFDDLTALQKSGRIHLSTALIGNLLNIKPVIFVDDKGNITNHSKVRGRKKSIAALLEKFETFAKDKRGKVYLAHSDCQRDVDTLAQELETRYGATVDTVINVGPVIGAHSGLGALVLSFIGKKAVN